MLRLRGLDERPRGFGTAQLQRDSDDLDTQGVQFIVQCLPPGQVEAAASIRRPGDQHHLLATQRGQAELVALDVVEHELR
jgi:hypothetical protein